LNSAPLFFLPCIFPTNQSHAQWQETDSDFFIQYGKAFIPERDKLQELSLQLISHNEDDSFTVVDICVGGGWLTEAILQRYPHSNVIALDGSESMLRYTSDRLEVFKNRVSFKTFDLLSPTWMNGMEGIDYFVSSLAIHHLNDHEKKSTFKNLYKKLNPGGKFIIADLIQHESKEARLISAQEWDQMVKQQSLDFFGDLKAYEFFKEEEWNLFYFPDDPIDKPSTLFNQLTWLKDAGFQQVDVHYHRAGHVLFSGTKQE